jgi:dihydroceramide fatty acyl 2-hydroxylase
MVPPPHQSRGGGLFYTEVMRVRLWVFGASWLSATGASLLADPGRPAHFAAPFAVGLLAWTILEYLLHRYAFHGFAPHTQHHADPADSTFIFAPLWLSTFSAAILFGLFSVLTHSWATGAAMISGTIAGYGAYETIHLRIHSSARGGPILRALRKHHFYHHFASDQVCYGVTSPLWDLVFRSGARGRIRAATDCD